MESKPMILKKKPALALTLGASIALIVGGGLAYWFLTNRRLSSGDLPVGVTVVPQNALMTLSFSTDEAKWEQLQSLGTSETQTILTENLTNLRDRLLIENGYDYEEDIQPWVGDEVTVAFLSPSASPSEDAPDADTPADPSGEQQDAIWILPIADPIQAQESLTGEETDADEATTRDYNGLEIREFSGESGQGYAATVIDRQFLVVSDAPTAIEQVIDTFKGQDSVAQVPGYRQALRQLTVADPFLQTYVNVPVASQIAANNNQPIPSQGLAPLQNNQGFAATVLLGEDGVEIQGIAWLNPDSAATYEARNAARRMPELLPAETLTMASGGNLQQLWQNYSERGDTTSGGPFSPNNLRAGLQAATGLNMDDDLIAWMDGEFALALAPTAGEAAEGGGVGVLFMVQASDRTAAEETLATLDDVMESRYRFQVNETEIGGANVVQWTQPLAGLTLTRGWLANDVTFLAFGPIADRFLPEPNTALDENSLFQQATASELEPNNGHFFVNLEAMNNADTNVPLPSLPPNNQAFVEAIRAIGVTSAIENEYSTRYDISVILKTSAESEPSDSPN
ncbi:MAG: DUF3352 domain-containing protein [Elainellaceae cyanobacterium]